MSADQTDKPIQPSQQPEQTQSQTQPQEKSPERSMLSMEMHNDRTHDSTVDTDGKNREAARLAGYGAIGPDEVTTSNATLDNNVPEADDGLAGFDSRPGGSGVLLAVEPGYTVVQKGMVPPDETGHPQEKSRAQRDPEFRGRIHYALNHQRPGRVIEFKRNK
ncbi:DUF3005 domain-containing protein [Paraburkholderia sp. 2C]